MNDSVNITSVVTGVLQVNTFIITDEKDAVVVDPGGSVEKIFPFVEGKNNVLILVTHAHYDHIGGLNELMEMLPQAKYYAHKECSLRAADPSLNLSKDLLGVSYSAVKADRELIDKEEFVLNEMKFQALHVPGHSPGHLCYYMPEQKVVFCGDTVFAHSIGRSDLPGGDGWDLVQNCREMLSYLPEDVIMYPGHGAETSVREEKATNPFL